MKKDTKLYTIVFTFIITFCFVAILSLANYITKDTITKNQEFFLKKAVIQAMKLDYKTNNDIENIYAKDIEIKKIQDHTLFKYVGSSKLPENSSSNRIGILFSGNGLWSTISGILVVNIIEKEGSRTFDRIIGIEFVEQNETPGLGGRIEEEWFKEQFSNELIIDYKIEVVKGGNSGGDKDKENSKVDTITGATQTAKSLEKILNEYMQILKDILGGGLI